MRVTYNGRKAFFVPIKSAAEKHKMIKRLTKRGYPRGSFIYIKCMSYVVVKNKKGVGNCVK